MKSKNKRTSRILRIIACILPNATSGYLIYMLLRHKLVPDKYLYALIAIIVLFNALTDLFIIRKRGKKASRITGGILLVVTSLLSGFGIYAMNQGVTALQSISNNTDSVVTISVISLKDSIIQGPSQISGQPLASVGSLDDKFIGKIVKDLSASEVKDVSSYPALVTGLYGKTYEVIVFNESYRSLIEGVHAGFNTDTTIIKQYNFKNPNSKSKVNLVNDSSPFNIYISGVDTRDPLSTEGLSDVNIVATVDPIEKKILLTNIPRDSYLPIALGGNNQMDKLTHAGIYGIDSSIQTIENLLDIQIDAYVRINFTALTDMVDVLGGVDVDNPVYFMSSGGDHEFPSGIIHLNGAQALVYSRERQQLENGDNDRGKNQERIIVAIFNKLSQPENLGNYQGILLVLGNSFKTNLSTDSITKLVNMQLNDAGSWDISMNSITGVGAEGMASYAMPGSYLYFTELSTESILSAKSKISAIININ